MIKKLLIVLALCLSGHVAPAMTLVSPSLSGTVTIGGTGVLLYSSIPAAVSIVGQGTDHTLIVSSTGVQGIAITGISYSGAQAGNFVQYEHFSGSVLTVERSGTYGGETAGSAAFAVLTHDETWGSIQPVAKFQCCGVSGDNSITFFSDATIRRVTTLSGTMTAAFVKSDAPLTSTSPGTPGQIAYDSSWFYFCTGSNQWSRILFSGGGSPW